MKVGSSSSIQASRPLNLLNWAASSPSVGRLPSFPCLAGYLKPALEPTKPSRTAIVLLALRLESLSYRLNLPIGGGLIPFPFTVPCDLDTDTPIYPKENQLKEERAPFPLLSLTKPPPVHSSTTDVENPIPSQAYLIPDLLVLNLEMKEVRAPQNSQLGSVGKTAINDHYERRMQVLSTNSISAEKMPLF
ncbi:hypothetical protein R6Q59_019495 [Mikania micrantha]